MQDMKQIDKKKYKTMQYEWIKNPDLLSQIYGFLEDLYFLRQRQIIEKREKYLEIMTQFDTHKSVIIPEYMSKLCIDYLKFIIYKAAEQQRLEAAEQQ